MTVYDTCRGYESVGADARQCIQYSDRDTGEKYGENLMEQKLQKYDGLMSTKIIYVQSLPHFSLLLFQVDCARPFFVRIQLNLTQQKPVYSLFSC